MDRYRIIGNIGEGSFASVIKAEDRESNQIVALKEIEIEDEKKGIDPNTLREIGILKMLSHTHSTHIVRLLRVEHLERKIILVLECMQTDLKRLMDKRALSDPQIQDFMYQLLKGVSVCHSVGLLHRDLKPQNLLIDETTGILKIADFGLGRPAVNPNKEEYTIEIGTPYYIAPEILLGSAAYSTGLDIWSVGCIFAQMSTGKVLVEGGSQKGQLKYIFSLLGTPTEEVWPGVTKLKNWKEWEEDFPKGDPQTLANVVPSLGPDGVDLLEKMLTYDPAKRISAKAALGHRYFNGLDRSRF